MRISKAGAGCGWPLGGRPAHQSATPFTRVMAVLGLPYKRMIRSTHVSGMHSGMEGTQTVWLAAHSKPGRHTPQLTALPQLSSCKGVERAR